jgi:hypothetical protein
METLSSMISSCPALCRASTAFLVAGKQDVDGRDKPGHDLERWRADLPPFRGRFQNRTPVV